MVRGRQDQVERTAPVGGGPDTFALSVPPEADQVRTTRLFAASIARLYGTDEDRVEDLKVAVSEAATNAIKAHQAEGITSPIRITVALEDDTLRFNVVDAGPGFDALAPSTPQDTPPAGLFEGSLGLTVIRALFPDVRITRNAARGMTVSFLLETSGRVPA